jgi:hypothetical protein
MRRLCFDATPDRLEPPPATIDKHNCRRMSGVIHFYETRAGAPTDPKSHEEFMPENVDNRAIARVL